MKQDQTVSPEIALLATGGDHTAELGDHSGKRDAYWPLPTMICPFLPGVEELPKGAGGSALMAGS